MLQMLGVERTEDATILQKLQKCRQQIKALSHKINAKLVQKDDEMLLKLNSCSNDEHKDHDGFLPTPKVKFPIKQPNADGSPAKGSAKFAPQRTLRGHRDRVNCLRWSADSRSIVSASRDGSLLIWDAITGHRRIGIPLRMAWVMSVDYSPNGSYVASGGLDNLCSVFNIENQRGWADDMIEPHRELQQHEGYISCVRFVDNEHILTASGDSNIILFDIEHRQPISAYTAHTGDVEAVAHNKSSHSTFLSGSIDMTARLWDYRIRSHLANTRVFQGHDTDINDVQWFPDYRAFGTASDDGTCRLWDVAAYQTLNVFGNKREENDCVTSLSFSKSGYYLAAGYDEAPGCLVWNTVTAELEHVVAHSDRVQSLQFQPNGYSLATSCWDQLLRIWV